jgi:glycine betaine/proline transport system ATP-binding protein
MNPLLVLRADDVMDQAETTPDRMIDADTPVAEVMSVLAGGASSVGVTRDGMLVGHITAEGLVHHLGDPAGAAGAGDLRERQDSRRDA